LANRVPEYNEGQSFTATFKFFDSSYVPSSPTTLRYRIDCLTSGITVKDWTTAAATQTVNIEVSPDDNKIQNNSNLRERKQMVVQTNYGTSTQGVETKDWDVKNLRGVT
jgi:hypothetical protein